MNPINIILLIFLGCFLAEAAYRAYRRQQDEILRLHVHTLLENGATRTGYRCGACKKKFGGYPAMYATCPSCRGRVTIRLPRG